MIPDELDALVAAPKNHRLLFQNEFVRVLDTNVPPGETVPLHTHRWPSTLYILSWSDFIRRDTEAKIVVDSRSISKPAQGSAVWSEPLTAHMLENVGVTELRVINVEMKTLRARSGEVSRWKSGLMRRRRLRKNLRGFHIFR